MSKLTIDVVATRRNKRKQIVHLLTEDGICKSFFPHFATFEIDCGKNVAQMSCRKVNGNSYIYHKSESFDP